MSNLGPLLRILGMGSKTLGRANALVTLLGTPVYYMSKAFYKYWLKDEDARTKKRNYVCNEKSQQCIKNLKKK